MLEPSQGYPTTVEDVHREEMEQEGEWPCLCGHLGKSHRKLRWECAACDCAAFLTEEDLQKFYGRHQRVPVDINGSEYSKMIEHRERENLK